MIIVGTKVAILQGRFMGQVGIVKRIYKDKIGVQIDGHTNPDSEYGVFWFEEKSCAVIPSFGVLMNDMVEQIIFSGPKTIIKWNDGTKTIVSCGEGDRYNRYAGFCAAVTKKMFGSTSSIKKIIDQRSKEDKKNVKN